MTELAIGLVGFGWMGRRHTEAYQRLPHHFPEAPVPRLEVVAEVDPDLRAAASALGYRRAVEAWHEVIADQRVDAVSIATPNWLHREVAVAAATAGKHIWLEKPAGRDLADARAIVAAVAAAGVVTVVGFDLRFAPCIRRAREIVAAGELGEIHSVRAAFLTDYAADPAAPHGWRFRRDLAGSGALGDLMAHLVDLSRFLVGEIVAVGATCTTVVPERPAPDDPGRMIPVENEDQVVAVARFAGGATGQLEASRVAQGRRSEISIELTGSDGALSWRFDRLNELRVAGRPSAAPSGWTRLHADGSFPGYAAFQPAPGLPMGYDDLKVLGAHELCRAVAGEAGIAPVADAVRTAAVLAAMEGSPSAERPRAVEYD